MFSNYIKSFITFSDPRFDFCTDFWWGNHTQAPPKEAYSSDYSSMNKVKSELESLCGLRWFVHPLARVSVHQFPTWDEILFKHSLRLPTHDVLQHATYLDWDGLRGELQCCASHLERPWMHHLHWKTLVLMRWDNLRAQLWRLLLALWHLDPSNNYQH